MKDQMDGLDIYVAGKATVNFVFDRYMSLKSNLKPTTKSNYLYMYDRFIRDTFGKRNIAEIKYSDVVQFYNHLIEKQELQINTLETVHTLLHPTFQLAVRDDSLKKLYPDYLVKIDYFSSYMATTGKKYDNHYHTILQWAKKDELKRPQVAGKKKAFEDYSFEEGEGF